MDRRASERPLHLKKTKNLKPWGHRTLNLKALQNPHEGRRDCYAGPPLVGIRGKVFLALTGVGLERLHGSVYVRIYGGARASDLLI